MGTDKDYNNSVTAQNSQDLIVKMKNCKHKWWCWTKWNSIYFNIEMSVKICKRVKRDILFSKKNLYTFTFILEHTHFIDAHINFMCISLSQLLTAWTFIIFIRFILILNWTSYWYFFKWEHNEWWKERNEKNNVLKTVTVTVWKL